MKLTNQTITKTIHRNKIIFIYYAILLIYTTWSILKPGSNVLTFITYINGNIDPIPNAFIQSYIYDFIFEFMSFWGSILIVLFLFSSRNLNRILLVVYQILLILSFLMWWIETYIAMLRIALPGQMNVYSFLEKDKVIEHIFSSSSVNARFIFLFIGLILILFVYKKDLAPKDKVIMKEFL